MMFDFSVFNSSRTTYNSLFNTIEPEYYVIANSNIIVLNHLEIIKYSWMILYSIENPNASHDS